MSRLSNFINDSLLAIHHTNQQSPTQFVPSAAKEMLMVHPSSYFSALAIIFLLSHLHCYFTSLQYWLSVSPEFSWVCSTTSFIVVVPLILFVRSGLCPSFPLSWLLPEIFPLGIYLTLFELVYL
jgi:hypothetical protein